MGRVDRVVRALARLAMNRCASGDDRPGGRSGTSEGIVFQAGAVDFSCARRQGTLSAVAQSGRRARDRRRIGWDAPDDAQPPWDVVGPAVSSAEAEGACDVR